MQNGTATVEDSWVASDGTFFVPLGWPVLVIEHTVSGLLCLASILPIGFSCRDPQ